MSTIADLLETHKEELLRRWIRAVEAAVAPAPPGLHELRDGLPVFLDELVAALRKAEGQPVSSSLPDKSPIAEVHGRQRLRLGFEVEAVAREYGFLRGCLFDLLQEADLPVRLGELQLLCQCIDTAVEEAVSQYTAAREAELQKDRELLSAVIEQMPSAVFIAEAPSGRFLRVNQQATQLLRHPSSGVRSVEEYTAHPARHPDGRPCAPEGRPLVRAIQRGETSANEELLIQRGDGSWGTFLLSATPVRDASGRIISGVAILSDITEAKHAQEALRRREEELSTLAESMPQIVWTARPNGEIDYINQRLTEYLGCSVEGAMGTAWTGLVHPEDLPFTLARWRHALETGDRYEVEQRLRRGDGAYRWFLVRALPMKDEAGRVQKWFGTSTDIDERKRAEARLSLLSKAASLTLSLDYRETLSELACLTVPALADWCLVDLLEDGVVHRVKVAHRDPARAALAEALHRYPPREDGNYPSAQGLRTGRSLLIPEYTGEMLRSQAQSPEHLAVLQQISPRSVMVVPLHIEGRVLAVMVFLATDESERRYEQADLVLAEEVAQRATQAVENARLHRRLQERETLLSTIFDTLPVGVWVCDAQGRLMMSNPAARLIWGGARYLPLEEYHHFQGWWADSGRRIEAREWALSRALLRGEISLNEEIRIRSFGGEERFILNSAAPLRDAEGRIFGAIAVNENITVRRQLEEARERFVGILGHDLRTPLSSIAASAEYLLRSDSLDPKQLRWAFRIAKSATRMQRMIDQVLDFARSRCGGGIPLNRSQVELVQLCQQVIEELEIAHPDRVLRLEQQGPLTGHWDADRLSQALSNLVGNAIEHGQDPITVWVRQEEEQALLEVHNQGRPIPPELLPEIFEPFRRAGQDSREEVRTAGLGLGLFIVRAIVQAHGGSVEAQSSAEEGTRIRVRLPLPGPAEGPRPGSRWLHSLRMF
jgi:PAS domain S-box-containing protein